MTTTKHVQSKQNEWQTALSQLKATILFMEYVEHLCAAKAGVYKKSEFYF